MQDLDNVGFVFCNQDEFFCEMSHEDHEKNSVGLRDPRRVASPDVDSKTDRPHGGSSVCA